MADFLHGSTCDMLKSFQIDTPLGTMLAISDDQRLYLLAFEDKKGLAREVARLGARNKGYPIATALTSPIVAVRQELKAYFAGHLKVFTTPIQMLGTTFQRAVWEELIDLPYGRTKSYLAQAVAVGRPRAVRAVANANGANQLTILVPCHRIIGHNGGLRGYGGGVERKRWLLHHEKKHVKEPLPSRTNVHGQPGP